MARRVAADFVRQALLVGHELLPGDVAGMRRWQADGPLAEDDFGCRRACAAPPPHRIDPPPAVDVSPGIGRVLQNVADPRAIGFAPQNFLRCRAAQWMDRQRQAIGLKIPHHP
jgi:hypothetical protein